MATGDLELSAEELRAMLRVDLYTFIERAFSEIHPGTEFLESQHIPLIAAKLQECVEGKCKRLIINLPPRSLKSFTVSVAFVAWLLGRNPSKQVICASYGQDLADKLARDCRTVMLSPWYKRLFPRAQISGKRNAVNDFNTTASGGRMATSVGGTLTGRGADFLILDDPLKPIDALSETSRKAANDWFSNTLLSRLNSKKDGVIIIVMQRLHQDDLVGHVQSLSEWEVLSLPAVAEMDESITIEGPLWPVHFSRSAGEILEPRRDTPEALAAIRDQIGPFNFNAQYQQDPIPEGGNIILEEWLRIYEENTLPMRPLILQSWDTANKSSELCDFSVCTTWAIVGKKRYLLNVLRKQLNYPDLKKLIVSHMKQWNATQVIIENRASGIQLCQDLRADGIFQVKPYDPPAGSDKIMRVHMQTPEFEAGNVLLPKSAPWLDTYVKELLSFPGGKYDDQVDSTMQALDYAKRFHELNTWAMLGRS
ncbi:phage terminase large subunit [Terriglobus sp. TAA 43]|uniref:phage terminase large subunit n=1 Tax=Terriglobus sp. TAA 43 TaxID=278961 RepID=UPI00068F45D0|nr:phage terminase large subunit [Terriglobus sp. TAA 43]